MRINTVIWQKATTKPESMETVIALDKSHHLWFVYWDADEKLWFNGQGQDELPPLKWWAYITFPEILT